MPKEEKWESGQNGQRGLPRRSKGCLAKVRPKGQKGPPQLRCSVAVLRRSVAVLRRSEALCRNIAMLRRGVDTVHTRKFSDFCFRTPRIRTRFFRNPNKLLMGVQIRIKLNEKRTVPHRRGEAEFVFE